MVSKKAKATLVVKMLEDLFPKPSIPLDHSDSYTLLIAVLLSAQCTDHRVNQVTPKLFQRAKTPEEMVKLSIEEIVEIIRACGLSKQKGRAIHRLSELLIEKHEGKVPSTFEELEALPGVGHKTASVVMCQAFQKPAFPVDTHIHRLAKRWGLTDAKSVKKTEEDLKKIFPKRSWNRLHLQMIYYGRNYCKARGHDLKACPICSKLNML